MTSGVSSGEKSEVLFFRREGKESWNLELTDLEVTKVSKRKLRQMKQSQMQKNIASQKNNLIKATAVT